MQVGSRIYYNQDGKVLFQTGEMEGDVLPRVKNEVVSYVDLPYGDTSLQNVIAFHIEDGKIVVDKRLEAQLSEEERRIRELEDQLIMSENNNIEGGIF